MNIETMLEGHKMLGVKQGEKSMLLLVLELIDQLEKQGKGLADLDSILRRYFD